MGKKNKKNKGFFMTKYEEVKEKAEETVKKFSKNKPIKDKTKDKTEKKVGRPKEYIDLIIEGVKFRTKDTKNKKWENRKKWKKKDEKKIYSPIPGKITKIFVEIGQSIKKGDKLYSYESMKMNNIVVSKGNVTIKNILLKKNSQIKKDEVIMEFT
jgi:biotin carboxyl carrier protein